MRVKITADIGNGITLPINYNHLLVGVIYRFLSASDPAFANFLHEEGFHAAEKRFKLFTFSQLMAERRHIRGEQIHFRSTLTWSVSSPVVQFLTHFADTLLTKGRLSIGDRHLKVRDVTIPRAPRFRSEMYFRCLSPIVMSAVREVDGNRRTHYCLPDDPYLSDLIRQNLLHKHQAIHGCIPQDDTLTFQYDNAYIRRKEGRVTRLVDFRGIKIRGVLCPFRVSGSVELIQTGYECGFGDKNSAGFGMVEV
ncbi:CRISPR-associated endoribonuclease Cas6 [Candidatus Poribacteria bacterium]|nr:CRISPR-associated endoribonuclease Cas6 [Candidatus Poribacteria bacterium]MYB63543.1 CRISPR-associated endoribonuclease Cas6 [Candidatus Poribacteria bacterium]MYI92827.1 CRISPR-associated endoribonuclease Cas6 [Candidatus Poribacteria bacterium]